MFQYLAKPLLKGGRVALLLYEGVAGSSLAVAPGKVMGLSNLQEGYVARNPPGWLRWKIKGCPHLRGGLSGSGVV